MTTPPAKADREEQPGQFGTQIQVDAAEDITALTSQGRAARLQRASKLMQENGWDALLLLDHKNIHYFGGYAALRDTACLVWMEQGECPLLVTDSEIEAPHACVVTYPSYSPRAVLRPVWVEACDVLKQKLNGRKTKIIASEFDVLNTFVLHTVRETLPSSRLEDASAQLSDMRRTRDPDQVEMLRRVSAIAEAGFERVRSVLRPGLTELDVYAEISAAMMSKAECVVALEGDFATGPRSVSAGGPPTTRVIESGDLCVYDLSPTCWGYQADLCRTFCAGPPSGEQQHGYEIVVRALQLAEGMLRPGCSARELWTAVREFMDEHPLSRDTFWHHIGHGVGLGGHEDPRLVPESGHVLRIHDVVSIEPGFYNQSLRGGLRIENTYWITAHGPVQLNQYPTYL